MSPRFAIGAVVAVALLCGCAAPPTKIKPAYVSDVAYRPLSCEELTAERARVAQALSKACKSQRGARVTDTVGMVILMVPVGSVCGQNQTAEIRRLKGELAAIENMAEAKGCRLPEIPDPVAKPKK